VRDSAVILLLAALAACRAPRIEGSGALVSAGEHGERVEEIIRRVEPIVLQALGTRWDRPYHVAFDPEFTRFPGYTRTHDRYVRVGPRALESPALFEHVIAHELVHVHMTGDWEDLPGVLQEGVADWIACVALGRASRAWEGPPPPPVLTRRMLAMSYSEYWRLDAEERIAIEQAAMFLASTLVFDGRPPVAKAPTVRGSPVSPGAPAAPAQEAASSARADSTPAPPRNGPPGCEPEPPR